MKVAVMRSPSMSHKQGIKGRQTTAAKSECAYKLHTFQPGSVFSKDQNCAQEEFWKMNCWFHSVASISTQS